LLLATLFPLMDANDEAGMIPQRLWVGMATLWFFWPIILAVQIGSSPRRTYLAVGVAGVLLVLPMRMYLSIFAPGVFCPDDMISLSPYDLAPYAVAYARGWAESTKRRGADPIILEGYGMAGGITPAAPPFSSEVLQKYRIQVEPIALCVVNSYLQGHARGYNTASVAEIKRRYGAGVIAAAKREWETQQQRFTDMANSGRADAERDVRTGRFAVLVHGDAVEGESDYRSMLRDRFGIELRRISAENLQFEDDRRVHASGYNEVSSNEFRQRLGEDAQIAVMWVTSGQSYESLLRKWEFDRARRAETASR